MVDPSDPKLSILQQCILLGLARSSFYYKPVGESEYNLEIMRTIDEIYLECPFYGVKRMVAELRRRGYPVNVKRVRRLMRLMGIEPLYPHPRTTVAAPENKKYPYLLRGLAIDHPNQVWGMDITYIPMRHGFMYLAAIIDVFSRRIMGWGLSNTMEAEWCAEIAEEAFRHGRPEIFNTDQGSQFTSEVFIRTLVGDDADNPRIRVSMDGRGRATDDGVPLSAQPTPSPSTLSGTLHLYLVTNYGEKMQEVDRYRTTGEGSMITFILKTDEKIDMTQYLDKEDVEALKDYAGTTLQSDFMLVPDWSVFESFSNEDFAAEFAHRRVRVIGTLFFPMGGWQNVTPVRMDFSKVEVAE